MILLAGSGTDKLIPLLEARKVSWQGPFTTLDAAVRAAYQAARAGGAVVFSPGCTSFEMFENEFDRGRKFKDAVRALCDRFAGGET